MIQPCFKYILFACLIILSHTSVFSQDLTGVWQGKFIDKNNGDVYKYEVQILQTGNGTLEGVTYSYLNTVFYCKASLIGFFKSPSGSLIKENKVLNVESSIGGGCDLMQCMLQYTKQENIEHLTGTYTSQDGTGGTVFLSKTNKTDFQKEKFLLNRKPITPPIENKKPVINPSIKTIKPVVIKKPVIIKKPTTPSIKQNNVKKDSIVQPIAKRIDKAITRLPVDTAKQKNPSINPVTININQKKEELTQNKPTEIKERKNEIQKIIYTDADSITIQLYDNGQIDGDIVTVYDNNRLVVSKQQLGTKPIMVKIAINVQEPYHELVLVADNLGDIPPNTSLMVVKAGAKRYEVQITSTEQQNAKVIFEYKKEL